MRKIKRNISKLLIRSLELAFISIGTVTLTFLFVAQPLEVAGDSMLPNFRDKEQLLAEKLSKNKKEFIRGEVVIAKHPQNQRIFVIKRIIALPNETITISDGEVYIGDSIIQEEYLFKNGVTKGKDNITENIPYTIPHNNYVLLGDNRENSADSRNWGAISKESIVGRGFIVYYPIKNIRLLQH